MLMLTLMKKKQKIVEEDKILKRYKDKSTISAFATHDQQAPILRGKNYWDMVLGLNATLKSNMYFLDGFSVGDDFTYDYEGKIASKSYTDDEFYFVHSGMFDIFNYTAFKHIYISIFLNSYTHFCL